MKSTRMVVLAAALVLLGILVFVIFILARREPAQPTNLPFSTLAKEDGFSLGPGYQGKEPGLLVIADPKQIENPGLDLALPPDLAEKLRTLDYRRSFALFVFQGLKGIGGYQVTVQQVELQGSQVTVRVEFIEPKPGTRARQVVTSPYHLIAIEKKGYWGTRFHFVLLRDNQNVAETTSYIP